jgi:hypothetical protein
MLDLVNGWNLQWETSRVVASGRLPLLESPAFLGENLVIFTRNSQQISWKFAGDCYQRAIFEGQPLTVSVRKIYLGYQLLYFPGILQGYHLLFDFPKWHQSIEIKIWEKL